VKLSIPRDVTDRHNRALQGQVSLKELKEAIADLTSGHAPGDDGIPTDFFKSCSAEVEQDLLEAVREAIKKGALSRLHNRGIITLIPKGGDGTLIKNFRPITLLSSFYKIVAKILARRLQIILPDIIRPNQTGYVRGRSIIDNIFLAQEAMVYAEETGQDLTMLLLDFEKAFDRISWPFMKSVMESRGFHQEFIDAVMTLYENTNSSVLVNGELGQQFDLSRSVRQGCPLAPFLFIVAFDALGFMLEDPRYGIKGFRLPNGKTVTDAEFADDATIYAQGTRKNLRRIKAVLDLFCLASGSKVNWEKSKAIWASRNTRRFKWGEEFDLTWVPEGQGVRYLGPLIGFKLPRDANTEPLLDLLKKKLRSWASKTVSQAGRVLICNQVLLASCWYIAACCGLSLQVCDKIRSLITQYMWTGRDVTRTPARVRWSTCILPLAEGGLGLIDPFVQTQALLAKLVVRSLTPGGDPWKVLMRHRIDQGRPLADSKWHRSPAWLLFSRGIKDENHSPLVKACLKAFIAVRQGLIQRQPSILSELLRQPLFGNPLITESPDTPLGMGPNIGLHLWAKEGLTQIRHFWDTEKEDWLAGAEIQKKLPRKGAVTENRRLRRIKLVSHIPWEPRSFPVRGSTGWFKLRRSSQVFFHDRESGAVMSYHKKGASELLIRDEPQIPLPSSNLIPIRVCRWSARARGFTDCDPLLPPDAPDSLWHFKNASLTDIPWDPGEWSWAKINTLKEEPFYAYTVKRGYAIGLGNKAQVSIGTQTLINLRLTLDLRAFTYKLMWHKTRPRKPAMLLWQVLNKGAVTGDWLAIRVPTAAKGCPLCGHHLETAKHLFWDCKFSTQIWTRVNLFSCQLGVPRIRNFFDVLLGRISKDNSTSLGNYTYAFQPWDILRSFIVWHTWVERYNVRYGTLDFSVNRVLTTAWSSTIHTGMAIRQDFRSRISNAEKLNCIQSAFESLWSPLFYHPGLRLWHFKLPRELHL